MALHSVFYPNSLLFHGGSKVCRTQFPTMIEEAARCADACRPHSPSLAAAYERDAAQMCAWLLGQVA